MAFKHPKQGDPLYNPHAGKGTRAGQRTTDWDAIRTNREKIDWREPPDCYKTSYRGATDACQSCDFKVKCNKGCEK